MNRKVIEIVEKHFTGIEKERVINELLSIKLDDVMANSRINLKKTRLSILILSKGDLQKVIDYTKSAKADFRDVIYWASKDS